ncbi:MAG: ATP-dependent helicase HrpA [Flavobacteriales bacterium]|jgi:ATP-dependent helicase HrpA
MSSIPEGEASIVGVSLSNAPNLDIEATLQALDLTQIPYKFEKKLKRELRHIRERRANNQLSDKKLQNFLLSYERAHAVLNSRQNHSLKLDFPESLPVSGKRDDIELAIRNNQVLILAGETGSGKTTQVPKMCVSAGLGRRGIIGHTQPRRIAARTVACRIAEETQVELGSGVGYQVRFNDNSSPASLIKLMTDGILLAEIQRDPLLLDYEVLIIDEAHERSLNVDFLLGYLKRLLKKRPELKVIITSATIDLERFSKHFDNAPVIEVSGRSFPVEVNYRPWLDRFEDETSAIVALTEEIQVRSGRERGDILIFLSGEREIRELSLAIKKAEIPHLDVLPLYARLSVAEQNKIFNPGKGQRVILSTNVAETSITVPGIRYVIDTGKARISRYSVRTKVQRLPIEAISQASANQRSGRCGRVMNGICYRLYDEGDFKSRPEFTDPEILRTNLASVILQMLQLKMGGIAEFPFIERPEPKLINDGFKLLEELKAVDSKGNVTGVGRSMYRLPVDPKFSRMLLEANKNKCLTEMLIIVSALSIQDPRERPADKKQAADEKHKRFSQEKSDFLSLLSLWDYAEEQRQELTQNQFRQLCKREYLNYLRLREWRELHHQIKLACKDLKFEANVESASFDSVHQSLLVGLLSNIGNLNEKEKKREYLGTRSKVFTIFPGSLQKNKKFKWLMAADFIETSQVFAHSVAEVQAQWIIDSAEHLVKKHYFEPHYELKSGSVKTYVKMSLWGLVLAEKQRALYSDINPELSREIFIRSALVEGYYRGKGKFYPANKALINGVSELEAKARRRDILIDDEALFEFYDKRIPSDICNLAGFEFWRNRAELSTPECLYLKESDVMLHMADSVTAEQFPSELRNGDYSLQVKYVFEPGGNYDGLNVHVPVELLHELRETELEWLVPGLLRDKCIAMVKALPKSQRKNLVPVPTYVDRALAHMPEKEAPLVQSLAKSLSAQSSITLTEDDWDLTKIDVFYRVNIVVVDEKNKVIDQSRDLYQLRSRYKESLQTTLTSYGEEHEKQNVKAWDFGELQSSVDLKRGPVTVKAYPALVASNKNIDLKLLDNALDARYESAKGICKLAQLEMSSNTKYILKELLRGKDIGLSIVKLGRTEEVCEDILLATIKRICFPEFSQGLDVDLSRRDQFLARIEIAKAELYDEAKALEKSLLESLKLLVQIKKTMKASRNALVLALAFSDINQQIDQLFYKGFIFDLPPRMLQQYPRFLQAILLRLEKAAMKPQQDRASTIVLQDFLQQHQARLDKDGVAKFFGNENWILFRWMLEELRVSFFAQALKTQYPVSEKRLKVQWKASL